MKKIMFVVFLMTVSIPALEAKRAVLFPEGYKRTNFGELSVTKALTLDTLSPTLEGTWGYWPFDCRNEYEATKLTPVSPCSVVAIIYGITSTIAGASKQCSLFVWSDSLSSPGAVLFQSEVTTTADSAHQIILNGYSVTPPVYVSGPFWVGNYEMDTLFPTSVVDNICNSSKYRMPGSSEWIVDSADYVHIAIVEYSVSVEEKNISKSFVTLKTSPSLFSNNTSISYSINGNDMEHPATAAKDVQIGIYDITGKLVKEIVNRKYNTGTYTVYWNGCDKDNKSLGSGVYFCSLTSGNQKIINKMILVK